MGCKRRLLAALLLLLSLVSLTVSVAAYEQDEVVGRIPILLQTGVGDGSKNALNQDSSLGNAAAEAARLALGTDIAILNGGDLGTDLSPKEVTWAEVQQAFSTDRVLAKVTITAKQLWQLLEAGVSYAVLDEHLKIDREASAFDGFPQISGFRFSYDMSAPVGQRIYSVTLDSGEKLEREDKERELTLCATEYMLTGGYDYPDLDQAVQPQELTVAEALADALSQGKLEASDYSGRIEVIGSGDYTLLSTSPMLVIVFLGIMVLATTGWRMRRKLEFRRE